MIKLAFFDVDGTLSVPRFLRNGEYIIGFPMEDWKNFCNLEKENAYRDCIPVLPVKRYAEHLKQMGARLFVLTASEKGYEETAKKEFIAKNFPNLFDEVIISETGEEKIGIILRYAAEYGIHPQECELVEDTYTTLLEAQDNGIRPTHISGIVCNL